MATCRELGALPLPELGALPLPEGERVGVRGVGSIDRSASTIPLHLRKKRAGWAKSRKRALSPMMLKIPRVVFLAGACGPGLRERRLDRRHRDLLVLDRAHARHPDRADQVAVDDDRQPALRGDE